MFYRDKLQSFADLATYSGGTLRDPSDPENIKKAEKWLEEQLGFLSRRDREDLVAVWHRVIIDPRDNRILFSAVKELQQKY